MARIACILGFLSVALGAFGAHGLQNIVTDPKMLANWETAAKYQMYHALAMFAAGWVGSIVSGSQQQWARRAGWAFFLGTVIFSGSLYLLVLTGQKWLGAITPLGGLSLLAGWAMLTLAASRKT